MNMHRVLTYRIALVLLGVAGTLHGRSASAQSDCSKLPHPSAQAVPNYELRRLPADSVDTLRKYLVCRRWDWAMRIYAKQYQPDLPDWVVYIDNTGRVRQGIIADNHRGPYLRDKRFIWAVVFSDLKMVLGSGARATLAQQEADIAAKRLSLRQSQFDSAAMDVAQTQTQGNAASARVRDSVAMVVATKKQQLAAAEATLQATKEALDTSDFRLARRSVLVIPDAVLAALIKGVAKTVTLQTGDSPKLDDSTKTLTIRELSTNPDSASMYVGFARLALAPNAEIELSLTPVPSKEFAKPIGANPPPPLNRVYTSIADSREHTFEIGLLGGMTRGWHVPTYDANDRLVSTRTANDFAGYGTLFVNAPWRWAWIHGIPGKQHWQAASVGVFGGTNLLSGNIGDQFAVGAAIGHIFGDAGLDIGEAWVPTNELRNNVIQSVRQRRVLIGVDFRL